VKGHGVHALRLHWENSVVDFKHKICAWTAAVMQAVSVLPRIDFSASGEGEVPP